MKIRARQILLLFSWLWLSNQGFAEGEWTLLRDEDGIRLEAMRGLAPIVKFRALTAVEASNDEIANFVMDVSNMTAWIARLLEAEVIDIKEKYTLVKTTGNSPWPVADRHMIAKMSRTDDEDGHTQVVFMQADVEGVLEQYPDAASRIYGVIMSDVEITWDIHALSPERAYVILTIQANPNGMIPTFFVEQVMSDFPYYSIIRLKKIIE